MRKFIFAATMMVPFAAFAGGADMVIAGDANLAKTSAASNAGVQSTQDTHALANAAGNGGVVVGAVSGNYTAVQTTALGKASPAGSYTNTTAQQTNVGGTVAAGMALNKNGRPVPIAAAGMAGGYQNSQAAGNASATAENVNVGGIAVLPKPGHHPR